MIEAIIGGAVTFFAVVGTAYIYRRIMRKKHWSQGYVILDRDGTAQNKKEQQPAGNQPTPDSMFPPGWG